MVTPSSHSGYSEDESARREFIRGAQLYGLRFDPAAPLDEPGVLKPQQLAIADTLARHYDTHVIEIPRRASKTTSIFCLLLGRCASRPGYQVTFSAQSGVAGSRRLREWKTRLDLINPPDDEDLPPWLRGKVRRSARASRQLALFGEELAPDAERRQGRGFRILMGEVGKGIYFDNGSQFLVLKPDASAVRGEAADVSWLDEAQEIDPDDGADLLAGLVPLQDTKPGSSIIISGTAGERRIGPMWEYLERLRAGDPDIGGIDYAAGDATDWADVEDEDRAMQLLAGVHPGIGTLTTLDKMRKNWRKLPRPQWAREYLSLWPHTAGARAVNAEQWEDGAVDELPRRPARVAFGLDVKPGGSVAAICAAWRDSRGRAYVELVEHRPGTDWLPKRMQELTRTYRGSSIGYDDIAEGRATATEAQRLTPRPRMRVQTYRDTAAGCVQFMRDLARGKLRHPRQTGLDTAAAAASRRDVRGDQGVWLWTVADPTHDITPLVAATRALRNWDQHMAKKNTTTARPIMGN